MTIRLTLYVLFLSALLPLIGLEVYNSFLARQQSEQALEHEARNQSVRLAAEMRQLVESTEFLLKSIALSPTVQTRDDKRCREYLNGLRAAMNGPAGIGVADLSGNVFCLSRELSVPINISDRRYFKDAIARRALSVGEYVVGRKGGVPAIHFGFPVTTDGRLMGVAFVPLNLEWMSSRLATEPWRKDAVVRVTDSNGTVVAAYPKFSDVGQRLDVLAPAGATKGFVIATSRISDSNDSLGVWVALSTAEALRLSNEASLRAVAWILASVLLGLALAEFVSRRLIHHPLEQLQQVADKLKVGEYDARTQRPLRVPEFRHLADTFERLARELQLRQSADLEAQKHLQIARDEALAASRSKTTFIASVNHDLRQPLNTMMLTATVLKAKLRDPLLLPLVERLERAAAKQTDLVNALLDISQLDAGLIRPVFRDLEVSSVWEQAIEDFVDVADAKQLHIVVEPCNETIRSDPRLLTRIVQNVLSNAVKYTPSGGTVVLRATRLDEHVELAIADSGVGIPAESQAAVWEEFRQLSNPEQDPSKGLGLGMAIIKRMADVLGHEVLLRSDVGIGTTVYIRVPAAVHTAL